MSGKIKAVANQHSSKDYSKAEIFGKSQAMLVKKYHKSFPTYHPTELKKLNHLAEYLGVDAFYVKDESSRFGLNAFKGLGGSYCIGKYIGKKCGIPEEQLTYEKLKSEEVRKETEQLTFVTATDGNHGRGIAWTAQELGIKAVVYMPNGSAEERLENIKKLGAQASITNLNYDDTVRFAAQCEKEKGWVLVQDTAWKGYEKIPTWIMQGYTTMAGALAGFFADYYQKAKPTIVIVEPNKADCIYRTAGADDGKIHIITGDMNTIMAGLACGEPCTVGWEMLSRYADYFVSMPDAIAAKGMRVLGNPLPGDERVISGESGAATTGFVTELMTNESLEYLRRTLGINEESKVLCFSTEGDTDKKNYRDIVWNGTYSSF